jgi:hypothetical protein
VWLISKQEEEREGFSPNPFSKNVSMARFRYAKSGSTLRNDQRRFPFRETPIEKFLKGDRGKIFEKISPG